MNYGFSKFFEELWIADAGNTIFHWKDVIGILFFLFLLQLDPVLLVVYTHNFLPSVHIVFQAIIMINIYKSYNFHDFSRVFILMTTLSIIIPNFPNNPFQPNIAFHIENSNLICIVSQMAMVSTCIATLK